jgi:hypothetical protein
VITLLPNEGNSMSEMIKFKKITFLFCLVSKSIDVPCMVHAPRVDFLCCRLLLIHWSSDVTSHVLLITFLLLNALHSSGTDFTEKEFTFCLNVICAVKELTGRWNAKTRTRWYFMSCACVLVFQQLRFVPSVRPESIRKKVNLSVCLTKHQITNTYEGVEV